MNDVEDGVVYTKKISVANFHNFIAMQTFLSRLV